MAYNFKNLADVELLSAMPEEANVLIEVGGATKRAPNIDVEAKIVESETLEEVPEGATVLAEVNGEIKRVPSDGLGGGKALIVKSSDFDNAMAGVAAAVAAAPADTYTANMTLDEVMEAFAACELIGGFAFDAIEGMPYRYPIISMAYDTSTYVVPCLMIDAIELFSQTRTQLYWTADGISTTAPESASQPE